ncbi:GTPase domain-containing protein [Polaromonas sp. YR568]|uniref:GTPase domain-containing protein n=1 Tax=Polaromonas sp. YR568 TaxID=1855301 RepID=UPI0031378EFD
MAEHVRVLVFGGTGVGKTSVCNELAGRSRPTANDAQGVTSKTHIYGAFDYHGLAIELIDTVGLHEADSGTVPAENAVLQLAELLKHSREGFNLLIHVAKAGRLTKQHQEDYDFFVNRMTERKIPTLLVLTGCENERPMSAWVDRNRDHYRQFQYREMLGTCFASGGSLENHFASLREESRDVVLKQIRNTALPKSVRLYGEGTGITASEFLAKLWNNFAELAGLPAKLRVKTNESVYSFMKRIGVPKKIADLAIQHLPDLIDYIPLPGPKGLIKRGIKILLGKILVGRDA